MLPVGQAGVGPRPELPPRYRRGPKVEPVITSLKPSPLMSAAVSPSPKPVFVASPDTVQSAAGGCGASAALTRSTPGVSSAMASQPQATSSPPTIIQCWLRTHTPRAHCDGIRYGASLFSFARTSEIYDFGSRHEAR